MATGIRRPAAAPAASSSTGIRRPASGGGVGPWASAIDAIHAAAARFQDPVGLDAMDLITGTAALYTQLATALQRCGQVVLDTVWIDPRVAEMFEKLRRRSIRTGQFSRRSGICRSTTDGGVLPR